VDYALWLYPLPDVVVLGDRYQQYSTRYEDCLCMNPGSFGMDSTFLVFYPYQEETGKPHPEFCSLDEFSTLNLSAAMEHGFDSDSGAENLPSNVQAQAQQSILQQQQDEEPYEEPRIEDADEGELEMARRAQRLEAGLAGEHEPVPDEEGRESADEEVVIGQDKVSEPRDAADLAAEEDDDDWEWEEVEEEVEIEVEVTDSEAEEEQVEMADADVDADAGVKDRTQDRTQNDLDMAEGILELSTQPDLLDQTRPHSELEVGVAAVDDDEQHTQPEDSLGTMHDDDSAMTDAPTQEKHDDSLAFHAPSASI
jgi:hypothetical protein